MAIYSFQSPTASRVTDSSSQGGGPQEPMDDLTDLKQRVTHIEAVLPTLATKADLESVRTEIHSTKAELIKWIVGTAVALGAAAITILTFVLNNAVPKVPQQPPIIINIPSSPSAAASPNPAAIESNKR